MKSLFDPFSANPVRQAQLAKIGPPRACFIIYFTPRSGSSRLTEILSQTKRLGMVTEVFNPNFVPNIAKNVQARDLKQYMDRTCRWMARSDGMFSFEITDHQLRAVFPEPQKFFDAFAAQPSFWLIREDIVAQAISLAKMVATKVAHTNTASPAQIAASDQTFAYNRRTIKEWLKHILVAEENSEKNFRAQGITPRRLSYEQLSILSPEQVVQVFVDHLDLELGPMPAFDLKHQRLGTGQNQDFAARFRRDEAGFLRKVAALRKPWLERLTT